MKKVPTIRIVNRIFSVTAALCAAVFFPTVSVRAQSSGVWTGAGGDGQWLTDTANWLGGTVATGSGQTADFSQLSLGANTAVHLTSSLTIGNLIFGNTSASPAFNWTLDTNGSSSGTALTLAGSGTPVITVSNLGSGEVVDMSAPLAGTQGFIKDGPGTLLLSNINTLTGTLTVKKGTVVINVVGAGGPVTDPITLGDPAGGDAALLINLNNNLTNAITCATGAAGNLTIGTYGTAKGSFFGNINLNGNNLTISNNANDTAKLLLNTGTISGTGNLTLVNNGSSASSLQASAIGNTGSVTFAGTCTSATGILAPVFVAPFLVSAINYNSSLIGVDTFTAPANPNGLTINSSSTTAFPSSGKTIALPSGLSNLTLNANSSGSITIGGTINAGFNGFIENSGTGTGYVYIPTALVTGTGLSNVIQNSATSPLVLSGANTFTNNTLVSNGTLLWNGAFTAAKKGSPITVYSGGILGGTGGIANLVTVQAGGTFAPGTNSSATNGFLTLTNNGTTLLGALSLNGNMLFKLNKYGTTKTNDYVVGTTALTNLGTGTLTLTNIGSVALTNGDKFTLFSSPVMGGNNLTIFSSYGRFTNNLAVDGSVTVGNQGPFVSGLSPSVGSSLGGTVVTITGTGFAAGVSVHFGATSAASVTFNSSTSLTVTTPAQAVGPVTVTVANPDGQSSTGSFTYVSVPAPVITGISPTSGPVSGGTLVTITGSSFVSGDTVQFGSSAPITATFNSSSSLSVTTPAHVAGPLNLSVSDIYNQTATVTNGFTFVAPTPAIWVAANGGGDGLWTGDASNWTNSVVPNGIDQTADFSEGDYTGLQTNHLDAPVTVGNIIFGTTDTSTAVNWTLDNNDGTNVNGNILTLQTSAGTPTITVADPLGLGNTANIETIIAGTNGLLKTGAGELILGVFSGGTTNTFTGGITIQNGSLFIENKAGDANSSDPVTIGSTNAGTSATLVLGNSVFPNPIYLATNAQGTLTITGDPTIGSRPALTGPVYLNGNNLVFEQETGVTSGNTYFTTFSGTGNITMIQNGQGAILNNSGTPIGNNGSLTLQGTGSGSFNLVALGTGITAFNYDSTALFKTAAPMINMNPGGETISSASTVNLPTLLTGPSSLTLAGTGNNLTLQANSTGSILIGAVPSTIGGLIVNSGTGTGSTIISAGIFNNSAMTAMVENSATSPLILSGQNYYNVPTLVSNGTLLDNCVFSAGQKGSPITVYSGGVLGGTGSIANLVTIQPGGTLAPGTNDGMTIGTLTLTNNGTLIGALSLSGNLSFKVNNGGGQSNDFVTGTAALTNLGTGTLTVNNVGPTLVPGNSFKLFSSPLIGGSNLTIVGPASFVNNLSVDGSIMVSGSTPPPSPATGVLTATSSSLTIVWTGGANQNCVLLTSTNVTLPLSTWTPVATNMVGASGLSTNVLPIGPGSMQFYSLAIPYN